MLLDPSQKVMAAVVLLVWRLIHLLLTLGGTWSALQVFSSKQRPKKLQIYGSDFRTHDWCAQC